MKIENRFETIHLTDRVVLVDKIATNVFKVIAANPQLGDLPLLPEMGDEVVKLAAKEYPVTPFYDGDEFPYYDTNYDLRTGYAKGFKASKELYPFSKDDMIEFAEYLQNCCINPISDNKFGDGEDVYSGEQCLQLYLDQRQKPQFIPEMVCKYCNDTGWVNGDERCSCERNWDKGISELQPKIDKTTNTLIGKWK